MSRGSSFIDVDLDPAHVGVAAERDDHGLTHAGFVRWLLGTTLVAIVSLGALNWYVDPTGVTGRSTRWLVAENSEVRSAKLDLYEDALARGDEPEIVLLGSSRTMKFDPNTVEQLTGQPAFNAAVSGGVPRDVWLFTRLIEERQRESFPHLVWGVDLDAFRSKQLRDGLATDPRMSQYLTRSERLATTVAGAGALTELQTLEASIRSVIAGGDAASTKPASQTFARDGMQLWSLPLGTTTQQQERLIRRQVAQYAGFIFERDSYDGIETEPLAELTDVIRIANDHGDTPTLFLTPYHPLAQQLLERYGLDERASEVRAALRALHADGSVQFELVDLSRLDSFDGDPAHFYDGIHMTPENTDRALRQLDARGALDSER